MPPRPFVNDALWRCLCPRWNQVPVRADSGMIGAGRRRTTVSIPSCAPRQFQRSYNAVAAAPSAPFVSDEASQSNRGPPLQTNPFANPRDVFQGPAFAKAQKKDFVYMTTEELYHEARVRAGKGRHLEVLRILNILIKDRRERPNLVMYTALLHSYTSAPWGTAGKIRKALEDMAVAGVEPDARACECALEALAVHPDSFLRTDILEYMKERWWNLTPRAEGFVVAGLLRERCFEQAMERLEDMLTRDVRVERWVWDKAIWILLEFGEVEEAFHVLNLKQSVSSSAEAMLSDTLWLRLLDVAAHKHMNDAASMIWHSQVVPGYLKPSTGTCFNVLTSASRVGDVNLATDVFRVLADRNTIFSPHHYEAILQCYLGAHDLPAALQILLIMHDSSLTISESHLHPLYVYLCRDPTRPLHTFMHLQDLSRSGRKIPPAAVNTCIRAAISLDNLPQALELYKALSSVCPSGPNTTTFNELFRGCHLHSRKDLAMYLASEMIDLNISPDRMTYDRLILTCCRAGDLDDAIGYYEEMRAEKMSPRRGTHETLVDRALEKGDPRCVALLREYRGAEYCVAARAAVLERRVGRMFEEREREESVEEALEALERGEGKVGGKEKKERTGKA